MIFHNVNHVSRKDSFIEKLTKGYQNALHIVKVTGRKNNLHMLIIINRKYAMNASKAVLNAIINLVFA